MNSTIPDSFIRQTQPHNLSNVAVYVILMVSLAFSLISFVCVFNLAAHCYKRFRNRQIDARMAAIARETTAREDDIEDDMREPVKLPTTTESDEEAVVDLEAQTEQQSRKRSKKKKKKAVLESEKLVG